MKRFIMFLVVFPIFLSVYAQQKNEIKKIIGCYRMWEYDTYYLINETSILRYGFSNLFGQNTLTVINTSYTYHNDTLKFCFNDVFSNEIDTVSFIWIYDAERDCFLDYESGDYYRGYEKVLEKKLEAFGLSLTMQDQIKKFKKPKKHKKKRDIERDDF